MELLMNKIVSSVVQILFFALIPFVAWLIVGRKKQKFTAWIGLKKPAGGKNTLIYMAAVTVAFLVLGAMTLNALKGIETATSEFAGLGVKAIPAILVYAVFNTSLPEEILFRGFLLKRLSGKLGFNVANTIQAVLFGLLHGVMFFSLVGIAKAVLIIVFTTAIAWFMGYVNEKKAEGSILPSWTIHALANVFSGLCTAFMIF